MTRKRIGVLALIIFLEFFFLTAIAQEFTPTKQVALTIDDLPYVGNANGNEGKLRREKRRFNMILETLKKENVPATGFVVGGSIEKDQWELLEEFHRNGNIIANHTYTHLNLNRTRAEKYIENIRRTDERLQPLLSNPKYFRYPYLATGSGNCEKALAVKDYLRNNNYIIAPVTIDTKDFYLNQSLHAVNWRKRKAMLSSFRNRYLYTINRQITRAEKKAIKRVNRPIKHILLIHMNTLNAHFLGDVIKLFRKRGYQFITLPEALKDPYYQNAENNKVARLKDKCTPKEDLDSVGTAAAVQE